MKCIVSCNNEILEKEYEKAVSFKIAPPKIKHLGIGLTKEVKDLYAENYETLIKEIKEDSKKWKDIPCSWIGKKINIFKMVILPKTIYGINVISIKLPMTFFTEQIIQKFIWNHKRPLIAKAILRRVKKSRRRNSPRLQTISQSYIIKTVWQWYKNRHTDQRNRIDSPEINPNTYGQLIFDKGGKNKNRKKDSPFIKWCWENWAAACKSIKLEHTMCKNKLKMT